VPQVASVGHCGPVVDMCWGLDGNCLVSVSTDQTARITTQWEGKWCEVARPQVRFPSSAFLVSLFRMTKFDLNATVQCCLSSPGALLWKPMCVKGAIGETYCPFQSGHERLLKSSEFLFSSQILVC
jgi:hypothetical protein